MAGVFGLVEGDLELIGSADFEVPADRQSRWPETTAADASALDDRVQAFETVDGIGPVIWDDSRDASGTSSALTAVQVEVAPEAAEWVPEDLLHGELPWVVADFPLTPLVGVLALDLGGVEAWADELLDLVGVDVPDDDDHNFYTWLLGAGLLAGWGAYTLYARPRRRRYAIKGDFAFDSTVLWNARTLPHGG